MLVMTHETRQDEAVALVGAMHQADARCVTAGRGSPHAVVNGEGSAQSGMTKQRPTMLVPMGTSVVVAAEVAGWLPGGFNLVVGEMIVDAGTADDELHGMNALPGRRGQGSEGR